MRQILGGFVLALLLAGCMGTTTVGYGISVPTGPDLDRFGLRERCSGEDASCTDSAYDLVGTILQSLGPANAPNPSPALGGPPFILQVDRDPPWEWRSSDGAGGTSANVVIDLEPLLAGRGDAIVRIAGDDPGYPIPTALAQQLIDALFIRGG
jgi:hypothetical protein